MADDARETADSVFAAADATWRAEIAAAFGAERVELYAGRQEGRGRPGSLLRQAFEAREKALANRHRARDVAEPPRSR